MLEELEEQYAFSYPALYKQLNKDGMLDWGQFGPDWYTTVFPDIKHTPPLLLFANDLEVMNPEQVALLLEDGLLFADPEHQFIPFATNGAGDWFAFYFNLQDGDDVPVVQVWHDANEACILAKNLQDFIFLQLLEAITDMDPDYPGLIEDGDFAVNCRNILQTHTPYLTDRQQAIVAAAFAKGKLSGEELDEIVEQEMNFEWLDSSFPYQVNED
ncbi:SMI1/KNR4 family protein [Chitinophaga nivalis]|uniref:SMI1/KNR4 family protein n=1 Tax=Chitinophaga nivalis TaxID=2991709 RepID=A0ABT3IT63_9BACT|nr:SMI1/KNR4 family protein [Chitinophaga nivalis]MCW3463138.1 SMI1/KNR4 family protein [Chitinophaga nivalis]MCW3487172.1 SMI1/KNR4 family protein [Chitinophaga nivalis]